MGAPSAVPDFAGWATKADLKCTDGRTIAGHAFQHQDTEIVPLVWQHGHTSVENVLGHAVLEHRAEGIYAYGYFNNTPHGQHAKGMVEHGDINKLSIFANQLKEAGKRVLHGMIREVSLVLSGANPGAVIDFVAIQHDGGAIEELEDEAIIHTGLLLDEIVHFDDDEDEDDEFEHADGRTVRDVYEALSDEEKNVVQFMIGMALESKSAEHSDNNSGGDLEHQEGSNEVTRRVFDQNKPTLGGVEKHTLSHSDLESIMAEAKRPGMTLKTAVEGYALKHGIDNIDILFPEARTLTSTPEWESRRMEWVSGVLNGVGKSRFSRVKTVSANITQEEARAKGYIKGTYKEEEWFGLQSRITTPTTVYKKQKLDRDDIIDVADFDVVAWMKGEMRLMLDEEIAGAILIGDGRDPGDNDKIKDPGSSSEGAGIRAIINENELYATTVYVNLGDANSSYDEVIEDVLRARHHYKGSGNPVMFTTEQHIVEMMLLKDTTGRRYYNTREELANALMVRALIPVEIFETRAPDVLGIIVNLADYNVGADKGGEVNMFDDFDIDYNQYKYLMETRISGALTKIKSAIIVRTTTSSNALVNPVTVPTFNAASGVVTIPTQTGVVYKNAASGATLSSGAQTALAAGVAIRVEAVPASGYYFKDNNTANWTFTRNHA